LVKRNKKRFGALVIAGMFMALFFLPGVIADGDVAHGYPGTYKICIDDNNDENNKYFSISNDNWGTELFRIKDTGEVGIGDTDPDATLEIVESGTTPFMISNGASGDGDFMIMDTSGNVGIGMTTPTHKLTIESTDDDTLRLIGPDGSYGHGARINFGDQDLVYIEEDQDDKLYIYSYGRIALMGGDVGIGTSSPGAKLDVHVGGGATGAATIGSSSNSATGAAAIALGGGTTASGASSIAMGSETTASGPISTSMGYQTAASGSYSTAMGYQTTASGDRSVAWGYLTTAGGGTSTAIGTMMIVNGAGSVGIGLSTNWNTITQSNTMAIMGGYVGIGTVSPDKLLHLGGDSTTGVIRFEASDGDIADLGITTNDELYITGAPLGIGTTDPDKLLHLGDNTNNIDGVIRFEASNGEEIDLGITTSDELYITGGNLGIGTTNPSTTLHVEGDVAFGDGSELTISSGVVTVTHAYHTIDTESNDISDNLVTINGYNVAGQILVIRAVHEDRTVIAIDDLGGNLRLDGNFDMNHSEDTLVLIYDGTNWIELSRTDNHT
jgi:hypothetical protein